MQKKELVAAPLVLSSSRSPTPYLTPNYLMIKINYIDILAPQWPSDNLLELQNGGAADTSKGPSPATLYTNSFYSNGLLESTKKWRILKKVFENTEE